MKKGTLIAVGVFAVLLVLVLATRDRGNVNVGVPKLELPVLDKAKVTQVEVSGAKGATLTHGPTGWMVVDPAKPGGPHPADESQVGNLLDTLKDLKAPDFVSERAEKHAEMEIDAAKGLAVKVTADGGGKLDLVFGKAGKAGGSYLRAAGSNQVFLTQSSLPYMLRREASGWRKRGFFPSTFVELSKVTVNLDDGSALPLEVGADGTWALASGTPTPEGFRFDADAARQVGMTLASLSAMDFADALPDEAVGLAGAHATVQAQLRDGKTVTVHLGSEPKAAAGDAGPAPAAGMIAVKVEGDPQLYLVPPHQVDALKKRLGDLRQTTLLSFDPEKATRLLVQAGGKKTVVAKEGGAWKVVEPKALPPGFEFDPGQVNAQLGQLKTLRAAKAVEGVSDAQAGLAKPATVVEISLEGAPAQTLKFGGEAPAGPGGPQVYAKGSIDGLTYAVATAQRERLSTGVELFKKPPPPPDFGQGGGIRGMESLPPEVRRQLEEQFRR
ncbi:MAG: DUF4340 domain-containing protein [Myxococcaceae bacterium]